MTASNYSGTEGPGERGGMEEENYLNVTLTR